MQDTEEMFPDVSTMITPRKIWETHDLPRSTVYAWISNGTLPAIRIGRHRLYIDPRDVVKLAQPAHTNP